MTCLLSFFHKTDRIFPFLVSQTGTSFLCGRGRVGNPMVLKRARTHGSVAPAMLQTDLGALRSEAKMEDSEDLSQPGSGEGGRWPEQVPKDGGAGGLRARGSRRGCLGLTLAVFSGVCHCPFSKTSSPACPHPSQKFLFCPSRPQLILVIYNATHWSLVCVTPVMYSQHCAWHVQGLRECKLNAGKNRLGASWVAG